MNNSEGRQEGGQARGLSGFGSLEIQSFLRAAFTHQESLMSNGEWV